MIEGSVSASLQPSSPTLFVPVGRTSDKNTPQQEKGAATAPASQSDSSSESGPAAVLELTPEEERVVAELRATDLKVKQHERAHLSAAGGFATSGASYQYTIGPDGRRYAVGGEVSISVSPESTPQATLQKARAIRRAALAPADPSAQDRAVASQASRLESQAQRELNQERIEEAAGADRSEAGKVGFAGAANETSRTENDAIGEIVDLIA